MRIKYKANEFGWQKGISITFPNRSYHFGDVKVNGETVGTWSQNFEGYWHSHFTVLGEERHLWTENRYWSTKADIMKLVMDEVRDILEKAIK